MLMQYNIHKMGFRIMKKILILVCLLFLQVQAAQNIHVKSLEEYNSILPSETLKVEVLDDSFLGDIPIVKGDILNCSLSKVKTPKRAKIDAKIYFQILSYEDSKGVHELQNKVIAKYAIRVLSKANIKEIPKKDIAVSTVGLVGEFFVTGFSDAVSFVDGAIENKEENRLKSGLKKAYDDSILSYVEYGQEIIIKEGDRFYLVAKVVEE